MSRPLLAAFVFFAFTFCICLTLTIAASQCFNTHCNVSSLVEQACSDSQIGLVITARYNITTEEGAESATYNCWKYLDCEAARLICQSDISLEKPVPCYRYDFTGNWYLSPYGSWSYEWSFSLLLALTLLCLVVLLLLGACWASRTWP
jgi:hypothetical protein